MSYPDVKIVRCNAAQTRQSRKNHFAQWGQPLGFNENGWVDRFTSLEKGEWADDGRYITWALVFGDHADSTDLLAHCETFQRKSITRSLHSGSKDVVSYGVASVYTPAEHRGRGYARQLLQLLHYMIAPHTSLPPFPATWGIKPSIGPMDAAFSVLYSGIGEKYYTNCRQGEGPSSKAGWIRQPITTRTWDITSSPSEPGDQTGWEWRDWSDLGDLETLAAVEVKRAVVESREGSNFAVLPEWELLRLHAARSVLSPVAAETVDRPYGLVLPVQGSDGVKAFATFTYPESASDAPTLRITYAQGKVPFEAIVTAARKARCTHVSMWGGRAGWDDYAPVLDSESEMPCYVVYGEETSDWQWAVPELYTWC